MVDSRIVKKILTIDNIEKVEKRIEEAEIELAIQKDLERQNETAGRQALTEQYVSSDYEWEGGF